MNRNAQDTALPIETSGAYITAVRNMSSAGGGTIRNVSVDLNGDDALLAGRQRMTIAGILADLGSQYSSTSDTFAQTLKNIGIPIDEKQLAEIIVMVLPRQPIQHGDDKSEPEQWNLEVVADVLAHECRSFNWLIVVQYLDQPSLIIRSELQFQYLTRLFARIACVAMPAAGLMRLWSNRAAQLAIIILSTKAARNVVDYSSLVTTDQVMPGDVPTPPNYSWMCLPLYSILLELAGSGMQMDVMEALAAAAASYPEYVLIGMAQVQDPKTGVRSEVLRRTLPLFTGLTGSRPTSAILMKRLLAVNPDLLVLLFRIALKRSSTVQDIVEIDVRLRNIGSNIARRVEEEGTVEELLGYWCVRADKADLNLDEWASTALERNPQLARSFVSFAKTHAEYLRPRNVDGGLLSFESFVSLIRAVQTYSSLVPIDDMRALHAMYSHHQQKMQNRVVVNQQGPSNPDKPLQIGGPGSNSEPGELNAQDANRPAESDEVEEEANAYFQRIYTSDISITDVIVLLKRFKTSEKQQEQEVFRCMIHNLFDEYRFFHKYPDKELHVTGKLFGALIFHQLVSSITLGIALRYVLEALRKDRDQGGSNEKMFRFGQIALEQFHSRLGEWPQYCSHLVQIPHFQRHCPELYQEAQAAITNPTPQPGPSMAVPGSREDLTPGLGSNITSDATGRKSQNSVESTSSLALQVGHLSLHQDLDASKINSDLTSSTLSIPPSPLLLATEVASSVTGDDGGASRSKVVDGHREDAENGVLQDGCVSLITVESTNPQPQIRTMDVMARMIRVNVEVPNTVVPPDTTRDQILFIINNIAKDNCETKTAELRRCLIVDYYSWFANYLVVKRVSTMPNLHPIYLSVMDALEAPPLVKTILDTTYHNATKLLQSPNITTSSSERSLLRNLGVWLGQVTLARNRPLLHRNVNLKDLLIWGYETGRLIAVCSFVAKIIEGVKESKIFRPPNPWLMAILGVMRELYEIEDLKMNIKFEVQVLCKNINIKIEDIPRGNLLNSCRSPVKDHRNPDFAVRQGGIQNQSVPPSPVPLQAVPLSPAQSSAFPGTPSMTSAAVAPDDEKSLPGSIESVVSSASSASSSSGQSEQTVIPNLAAHVTINPTLQYFITNPQHKRLVSLAVDRAIREIIQPVVERSVTIASVTTRQLVLKDFSSEPNELQLRSGAHLMISNLAGSLALVTCREPLRISISNHLRTLLAQTTSDAAIIDQIVQVCSNDNLELGCYVIEKASTEKAIRDVDESLAAAIQQRRKQRESGTPFVDTFAAAARTSTSKYPRELPDTLKPRVGGLLASQLSLYEAFQRGRISSQPQPSQQQHLEFSPVSSSPNPSTEIPPLTSNLNPNQMVLTLSQALESYHHLYSRLDSALKAVQIQAQGRDIPITMLGPDHEILSLLRELVSVCQRTQSSSRVEAAMTFCETVFKLLMESSNNTDALRLEVSVGVVETLRDTCGGTRKFIPEVGIIGWLSQYSTFNLSDETARKIHRATLFLLLRAKLLRTQEIDLYFASCMDRGNNLSWVELALMFISQCLADGLAQTYEFPNTFDTVSKMRPTSQQVKRQLQKWLTDLRTLSASKEVATGQVSTQSATLIGTNGTTTANALGGKDLVRDQVKFLLEKWLRVWSSSSDQVFSQYLNLMHQYGVFKTEDAADRFFRVSTELCTEACIKSGHPQLQQQGESPTATALTFTVIDALSKLFLLLVRLADKESTEAPVRVNLLARILNSVARSLLEDHENKKIAKISFDQRPYFRLLSNLSQDLGVPDHKSEPNPMICPLLTTYYHIYLALQPTHLPGFAFAWLQLISHRSFMPHLLMVKGQKCWPHMHRLVIALLVFLQPSLKAAQLNDSVRRLYKGTLRVLLVLLHDFPEFLCDYHLSFCDVIPATCVQLRNLILSAFPRSMRLPDPFTPNLKVDLLPEILQSPRIPTDYMTPINERGIRQRLDTYMASKQPPDLPSLIPSLVAVATPVGGSVYHMPLLMSIVVYVGAQGIVQLQSKVPLQSSPSMEIFKQLVAGLDAEGRFHLFNAMANQLRYPNSHTHYFSCVLLCLFAEAENEFLQEQITRVLLERLIVHRPHPVSKYFEKNLSRVLCVLYLLLQWGLLITFIELIKNPRYAFWGRGFTRCAPEIERVFESVAKSCMGPSASTAIQQQQRTQQTQLQPPPEKVAGR